MCIRDSRDIIESSQSPYTSPIVAFPKKNGQVRRCLDVREINKMIINDMTSPGEIEEILKRCILYFCQLEDVYKRQLLKYLVHHHISPIH